MPLIEGNSVGHAQIERSPPPASCASLSFRALDRVCSPFRRLLDACAKLMQGKAPASKSAAREFYSGVAVKHYTKLHSLEGERQHDLPESADLYISSCSLAALAQVFVAEGGNTDTLMYAADARHPSPLEPFALIVCNAYIASRRRLAEVAVKIPQGKAMSSRHLSRSRSEDDD